MVDELGLCGAEGRIRRQRLPPAGTGIAGLAQGVVADVAELSVVDGRRWTEVQSNRFGTLG